MSNNNVVPARLPQCVEHPHLEPIRKQVQPGLDAFFCPDGECGELVAYACMSEQNGDKCRYAAHESATHMTLTGENWVDVNLG